MLLESKYLNQKLDVATIEKEENGHILQIITHDSLRDIFLNQIAGVIAEYQVISSERHHSVVLCRIFNDKGRSITEIEMCIRDRSYSPWMLKSESFRVLFSFPIPSTISFLNKICCSWHTYNIFFAHKRIAANNVSYS